MRPAISIRLAAACAILIACAAFTAYGDAQSSPAARKAETRRTSQSLKATVDMSKATKKPRLGKNEDGSLMFFGAPAALLDCPRFA
jgi:hypothetical protein